MVTPLVSLVRPVPVHLVSQRPRIFRLYLCILMSGHSGQEHVLSLLREKFLIIKRLTSVRNVVNRCMSCKRRQAPVGIQKMADLPVDRVTSGKPPFSLVGVNCFGPFIVRKGRSQVKWYGALYTFPVL